MRLTCDRSAKRHYADPTGKRYFGITQVLKEMDPTMYAGVPMETLEAAARKGKAVHHWFALLMYSRLGLCPAPQILEQYEGYCQAILKWTDTVKPEPIRIEQSSIWTGKPVAGQPDLLCLPAAKPVDTLYELKTTAEKHRTHKIQVNIQRRLSAYASARAMHLLYVYKDGTYDDIPVKPDPIGEAAFLNTVNLLNWRNAA